VRVRICERVRVRVSVREHVRVRVRARVHARENLRVRVRVRSLCTSSCEPPAISVWCLTVRHLCNYSSVLTTSTGQRSNDRWFSRSTGQRRYDAGSPAQRAT
jgi:hypothetical protein